MATLSSLLVQREIASMRTVEDAIARQVIHGGDLATNLLEVASLSEATLLPVLAEATGLEAAPAGRLPPPPSSALRAVPGELALRHGVFPLSRAADVLVLATSQPLPGPLEDDLSFALGVALQQLVAPLVRIRQAIAEHYGQPLDRRFLRLVAKLDGKPDPSPSSLPPGGRAPASPSLPRPASAPPASFGSGPVPGSKYGASSPGRTPRVGVAALAPSPVIPRAPAAPRLDVVTFAEPELADGSKVEAPAPAADVPALASPAVGDALAGWAKRTARGERQRAPARAGAGRDAGRARRKGPMTAAMAENELELTSTPDALLEVHFSYVCQFFEYAVLFVAHGDLAEGRNAAGPGADRSRVAGIGVPLDLPSILATARDRGAPMVVSLSASGLDGELARDLSRVRVAARGGMVAVIPVVVRGRAVALLYGDDGEDDVELGAIGEVIAFTALVEKALERAILRRKLGTRGTAAAPVPRAPAPARAPRANPREGAAVLARAMVPAAEAPTPPAVASDEPLAARVSPAAESVRPAARPAPAAGPEADDEGPEIRIEEAWDDTLGDVEDELGDELAGLADSGAPPVEAAAPALEESVDVDDDAEDDADDDESAGERDDDQGSRGDAEEGKREGTDAPARPDDDLGRAIARVVEAPPPLPGRRQEPVTETWTGSPTAAVVAAASTTPPLPSIEPLRPTLRGFAAASEHGTSPAAASWPPRRGQAPTFERGAPSAREPGERLPVQPPANATSVPVGPFPPTAVSFTPLPAHVEPSAERDASATPPPATAAAVRPRGAALIPREDVGEPSPSSPDASEILGAADASAPRRPSLAGYTGSALPSIIVDVGAEYASLLERVLTGGPASDEAFAELVRSGDQVLPALAARFPGPLRVDRHRARDQLPAASQCGPILELLVAMRRAALGLLTVRSSASEPDHRFWATHALGELRYTEAANAVLPRLFDDEPSVRRVARRAAASLVAAGEPGQPILRGLEHIARNADEAVPRRVDAVETMGDIRAASMVPALVEAVRDPAGDVREAARRALLLVTRQDFDRDAERWNDWWLANGHRHRVDWLIDALMHEVPSIRRAAGDELKQLTKEYFGYYDDLPRKERERAQARYREWWEREGKARFQA